MLTKFKYFGKKSKMIVIAYNIYDHWWTKRRFNSGRIESDSGSTHSKMTLSESLGYISDVFEADTLIPEYVERFLMSRYGYFMIIQAVK